MPETYDMVTIYFSDIVGFTTLAGMSTPIEVRPKPNYMYVSIFMSAVYKYNTDFK